jgi:hypothetical protein
MNDTVLKELKIIVERAVRPVQARLIRKRKMCEELLGHLVSIYEEEAARLGDEQAALRRTQERFGNPRQLAGELQSTVPHWHALISAFERLWELQPSQSAWRVALRYFVATLVLYVGGVLMALPALIAMPAMIARGRAYDVGTILWILLVTSLFSMVMGLLLLFLPLGIGRALYGEPSERSLRRATLYCLASLPIFPAMAFLVYWPLTGDLSSSLDHFRLGCYLAPAAPILFLLIARQVTDEVRYQEEWACLDIGE